MAKRQNTTRTSSPHPSTQKAVYIDGNVVRKMEPEPVRRDREVPHRKRELDHQVKKNRRKASYMSPAYVGFLAVATIITLIACVWYLQLRSELTGRTTHVTRLQRELADMKEENTAEYDSIMNSINLETVREKAVDELGMKYATPEQVITYKNPIRDYVKQYQDIPQKGIKPKLNNKK